MAWFPLWAYSLSLVYKGLFGRKLEGSGIFFYALSGLGDALVWGRGVKGVFGGVFVLYLAQITEIRSFIARGHSGTFIDADILMLSRVVVGRRGWTGCKPKAPIIRGLCWRCYGVFFYA